MHDRETDIPSNLLAALEDLTAELNMAAEAISLIGMAAAPQFSAFDDGIGDEIVH